MPDQQTQSLPFGTPNRYASVSLSVSESGRALRNAAKEAAVSVTPASYFANCRKVLYRGDSAAQTQMVPSPDVMSSVIISESAEVSVSFVLAKPAIKMS